MSFTSPIRNYKHDIGGKFNNISYVLSSMNESIFEDKENNELFHAIHEVLLNMVKTSRNTMLENLDQGMKLIVSDKPADTTLTKLHIEGIVVRYLLTADQVTYYLFTHENTGNLLFQLGKIHGALPIKSIQTEMSDPSLNQVIDEISLSISQNFSPS